MNSSPIETWDSSSVFYSFAGTGGTDLFFWVAVLCCLIPLYYTLKGENEAEDKHKQ